MIRALIIDDEEFARKNLELLVKEYCTDIEEVILAATGEIGLELLESETFDIVFLDVNMPNMNGFTFLEKVKERDFELIFTTAHSEHALRAIQETPVGFLEKPIDIDALQSVVNKAVLRLNEKKFTSISDEQIAQLLENISNKKTSSKMTIPTRDGLAIVDKKDIINLEATDGYTTIHLTGNRKYLSSKNIKVYEEKLDETMFFRIHKSHIINIEHHLKEFHRTGGNVAILSNEIEVPISRRKLPSFISRISNF